MELSTLLFLDLRLINEFPKIKKKLNKKFVNRNIFIIIINTLKKTFGYCVPIWKVSGIFNKYFSKLLFGKISTPPVKSTIRNNLIFKVR